MTSNRAAVGVGLLAHSSSDLYMCGGHGVCVRMMHVFGDKLWGMEPSVCQQVPLHGSVVSVPTESDFPPLGSEKPKPVEEAVKQVRRKVGEVRGAWTGVRWCWQCDWHELRAARADDVQKVRAGV